MLVLGNCFPLVSGEIEDEDDDDGETTSDKVSSSTQILWLLTWPSPAVRCRDMLLFHPPMELCETYANLCLVSLSLQRWTPQRIISLGTFEGMLNVTTVLDSC